MKPKSLVKRTVLYSLIASVALGAILAIYFVLANTWGWYEVRIILTTIVVAGASICIMACDLSRTPKGWNILPYTGFALTTTTAVLMLFGMWAKVYTDYYWQSTCAICTFALATVHISLLSVVPLSGRLKVVSYIAYQVILGLAAVIVMMIIEVFHGDDHVFRLMVVLAIIDAALTLAIPLLSRIAKTYHPELQLQAPIEQANLAAIDQEISFYKQKISQLEKKRTQLLASSVDSPASTNSHPLSVG